MSIKNSRGVNEEDSNGVNCSRGVNMSTGANWSRGVNESRGVNWSYGVNESRGVNWSDGVNMSFGVINSFGVDKALFLADKKRTFSIFGIDVKKERFNEVQSQLYKKLNGWFPKFNNAFELLDKHGEWSKVPVNEITSTLDTWEEPYEAWKDMPPESIEYVKSLPEFNAVMFKRITGIDTQEQVKELTVAEVEKLLGHKVKIVK